MAERYMGKSNAKAYGRRNSGDGEVLVRITFIEELEERGELPKDVLKGGERYEDEEPRQGL